MLPLPRRPSEAGDEFPEAVEFAAEAKAGADLQAAAAADIGFQALVNPQFHGPVLVEDVFDHQVVADKSAAATGGGAGGISHIDVAAYEDGQSVIEKLLPEPDLKFITPADILPFAQVNRLVLIVGDVEVDAGKGRTFGEDFREEFSQ